MSPNASPKCVHQCATHQAPGSTEKASISPPLPQRQAKKSTTSNNLGPGEYRRVPEKPPTPEPIDPGRFERFSLSTSLNSALNDMFLPVLQLRLKYGIGWAGAELLHAEITARQITKAEALTIFSVEVADADDEERFMKGLPPDSLNSVRERGHLNLPLIAYSYLVRRFLVCLPLTFWVSDVNYSL